MAQKTLDEIFGQSQQSKTLDDIFNPAKSITPMQDVAGDLRGIGQDIISSAEKRAGNIGESFSAMKAGEQSLGKTLSQSAGQLAGAGSEAIGATLKGAANVVLPQTTEEAITKKISGVVEKTPLPEIIQKYEQLKQTNPVLARDIDSALGLGALALDFAGLDIAKRGANLAGTGVKKSVDEIASGISEVTSGAKSTAKLATDLAKDVTPTSAGLRDRAVAGGLRLAPSDISTFKQISGGTEDIGEFMSRNKLILDTPEETVDALVKFKKRNYELTRDAIALDDNKYTFADIPELETTVDFLINDLSKTKSPEYQNVLSQLQKIKSAGEFDLLQAQYVKNVFDDIESVYKRTGEVREAIGAEDKALTIQPVRRFIEDRVSENYPTIDIRGLNRNVQLSSEILDSIAKRAPKADTASVLRLGDYATLGVGNQVLPGSGFAALFTKKVAESAPVKLRFARLMARRAEKQALKKGEALKGLTPAQVEEMSSLVESELRKAIEMNDSTTAKEIQAIKAQIQSEKATTTSINNSAKTNSISNTVPQKKSFSNPPVGKTGLSLKNQRGFIATGYKGESDLTTKILKDLEGKTTVSKQYILDATNRGELKQVERDLIREVLNTEKGDTINVSDFAKKVKAELLPLKVGNGDADIPVKFYDSKKPAEISKIKVGDKVIVPDQTMVAEGNLGDTGYVAKVISVDRNNKVIQVATPEGERIIRESSIEELNDLISAVRDKDRFRTIIELNPKHIQSRNRYENIALPYDLRGNVKNYKENIYESPIKTSAGDTHFGGDLYPNYFGHTRIEDMADNKTRRVIEVQSDLYQKGRLESEFAGNDTVDLRKLGLEDEYGDLLSNAKNLTEKQKARADEIDKIRKAYRAEQNKGKMKLEQYNDRTAHFRMIREEIKKAAQDGKTKLQFPTGETAMKIEGLGQNTQWIAKEGGNYSGLKPDNLKVGLETYMAGQEGQKWIITDVLGDGKFKAVPKDGLQRAVGDETDTMFTNTNDMLSYADHHAKDYLDDYSEEFDISGKVDTNNPIYRFYEKDVQKYLNKFGGKRVVDDKGVSWIEVPIKKEYGDQAVEAFGKIGVSPLFIGAGLGAGAVVAGGAIKKRK